MQQWALLIYAKVLELAAIGGTNYTAQLTGTLLQAAACPPSTDDEVMAANINVAFNNATSAGATPPSTIQTKIAAVKRLQHVPGGLNKLKQIDLYLNCALGRSKSFPQ